MKKWIALLLALLMVLPLVACATEPTAPEEPEVPEEEKNILDIYLIAGQSNAAGHTKVKNASALYEVAPELQSGYSHVLYAGNARRSGSNRAEDNDKTWMPTKIGLGIDPNDQWLYMGPEAGMAAALSGSIF